jgi:uncharacterized protein YejL (UPF0352 family)
MFNNPFNSKIVADITKFLEEHRNDVEINPCLNDKAKEAAIKVVEQTVLEEQRNVLVKHFNEAIRECNCRGTTEEANNFAKAVQTHIDTNGKNTIDPAKN